MHPIQPRRPRVKLICSAVSELLNVLNMTETELAQRCGLSPGYFSRLMAGKRSPSPEARRPKPCKRAAGSAAPTNQAGEAGAPGTGLLRSRPSGLAGPSQEDWVQAKPAGLSVQVSQDTVILAWAVPDGDSVTVYRILQRRNGGVT